MLKIGLIDDENTNYEDYAMRLKRRDIELLFYDAESNVSNIIRWLVEENIFCVLVDYDLQKKFSHNGTDLVFELNQLLPDFPCIMLTNYPERAENEKLVAKRLIWDREKLNASDLSEVVETIKNEVEVYLQRKTSLSSQYAELENKRQKGDFTIAEEERFMQLHSLLSKYGETDDVPSQLLASETNKKLDGLITRLTQLLDEKDE